MRWYEDPTSRGRLCRRLPSVFAPMTKTTAILLLLPALTSLILRL